MGEDQRRFKGKSLDFTFYRPNFSGEIRVEIHHPDQKVYQAMPFDSAESANLHFFKAPPGLITLLIIIYSSNGEPVCYDQFELNYDPQAGSRLVGRFNASTGEIKILRNRMGINNSPGDYIYMHTPWDGPRRRIYRYNFREDRLEQLTYRIDSAYPLMNANDSALYFFSKEIIPIWYRSQENGGDRTLVFRTPTHYFIGPVFHPKYNLYLFTSREPVTGRVQVCQVNADGSGFQELTDPTKEEVWKPAVHAQRDSALCLRKPLGQGTASLAYLNLQTAELSPAYNYPYTAYQPNWNSTGTGYHFLKRDSVHWSSILMYQSLRAEDPDVVCRLDSIIVRNYTFSPDESQIAFIGSDGRVTDQLFLYERATKTLIRLTERPFSLTDPNWIVSTTSDNIVRGDRKSR